MDSGQNPPMGMNRGHPMYNGPHMSRPAESSHQFRGDPNSYAGRVNADLANHFQSMRIMHPSWNVNAPEFVPRAPGPQHGMSSGAAEFVPGQRFPSNNLPYEYQNGPTSSSGEFFYSNGGGSQGMVSNNGYGEYPPSFNGGGGGGGPYPPVQVNWMDHLLSPYAAQGDQPKVQFFLEVQVGIEQIIQEPEKFQDFCEAIRDRMIMEERVTPEVLGTVASIIINITLNCSNVTYPIGKLCAYLCDELGFLPEDAPQRAFQDQLLRVCRMVHEDRFTLLETDSERLRRFAIFMAELFTQMKTHQGSRLNILGKAMLEQIATLMTPVQQQEQITEQNLKSVIRILKCCGLALEGMSDEEKYVVNSTIIQLQNLKDEVSISESTKKAIEDLAELQKSGWTRGSSNRNQRNSHNGYSGVISEMDKLREDYMTPVMFGPDGKPLSEEETAFLQEHLGRQESSTSTTSAEPPFPSDLNPPQPQVTDNQNSASTNPERTGSKDP